jgi:hypothetical protein
MAARRVALVAVIVLTLLAGACSDDDGAAISGERTDGGSQPEESAGTTTTVPPVPTLPPPATAPTCPTPPATGQPDPRRPAYTLSLDVRLDENLVRGTTSVRFTPDLDTDRVVFRLWANGPRPTAGGGSIETGEVTVDGRSTPSTLEDPTTLVVRPSPAPVRNRSLNVSFPWTLHLPGPSRDRIAREGDSVRLGSFFPILPWEPGAGWALDPPTGSFAEASLAPVADFELTVTVPDGLSVLASGVEDRPGHWTAKAMRDVALSVGRFTTASGTANAPDPVQVTVGVAEGIGETPQRYLTKTIQVLNDFGQRYGPYPWSTFTLAITPNVGGGIEYPGHVMQGPGTAGRTTSHEVAHQWFYALVGNNQGRDPWLDEGLASWGEARVENALEEFLAVPMPPGAVGRLGQPMTYWSGQPLLYSIGVYVQGVQALAALGPPDLVDCALRVYTATFAHRIARPPDLVAAMRSAFPEAESVFAGYGVP